MAKTPTSQPTLDQVRDAFSTAQKELVRKWQMKGVGHVERASVNSRVGRAIKGLKLVSAQIHGYGFTPRTAFPRPIVERAAEILGVPLKDIACKILEEQP